jgi:hypothetical protein
MSINFNPQQRRIIMVRLLSLCLTNVFFLALMTAGIAFANEDFQYHIINKNSDKCLTVKKASTSNGADIIQWTCYDQPNNLFGIETVENGFGVYYFRADISNKCAVVKRASTSNGADIIQWTCHDQPNTLWELDEDGDTGYFQIVSRVSGKCMTVKGASKNNGADIIQTTCQNQANQLWKIRLREVFELY